MDTACTSRRLPKRAPGKNAYGRSGHFLEETTITAIKSKRTNDINGATSFSLFLSVTSAGVFMR